MTVVLPFDVDEAEFVRGVEVGLVWAGLGHDDERQSFTVHASNVEMMLRIAEASGRAVRSIDVDETWVVVEFAEASH